VRCCITCAKAEWGVGAAWLSGALQNPLEDELGRMRAEMDKQRKLMEQAMAQSDKVQQPLASSSHLPRLLDLALELFLCFLTSLLLICHTARARQMEEEMIKKEGANSRGANGAAEIGQMAMFKFKIRKIKKQLVALSEMLRQSQDALLDTQCKMDMQRIEM